MSTFSLSKVVASEAEWPAPEAIAAERVLSGAPVASTLVIEETPKRQLGLWRVWPGEFTTVHDGYAEFIHIIEGLGSLVDVDGVETLLTPGVTVFMSPGWTGRWVVHETLTKAFSVLY